MMQTAILRESPKGDSITRFQYDALDRLAAVDTPDGQRLTYEYKSGERSLIEQYEHASVPVADLRDTGFTFSNPFAAMESRPLTASFGELRFSESLGTFQLADSDSSEVVRPQEGVEAALGKLHLYEAGMTEKALWSGFNAPFNNMFVPAEYLTINCCPECYGGPHGWICPPCEPPPPPPPIVSISGPSYVPLRTGSSTGPNSMTLAATVDPSGGTYSWTTSSNKVSLSNTSTANVTVTSVAASAASGDVPIKLTYTANNQSTDATVNITVRRPSSLQLVPGSDTVNATGHTCNASATSNTCAKSGFTGSGTYTSYVHSRSYYIMDQFNQWISGYALDIQEAFSSPSGQCASDRVATGGGSGDTIQDCFYFCSATCQSGGSCSVSSTQTATVNGFTVATKNITWTCSSATAQP
jgi:YD repeat-containing protein